MATTTRMTKTTHQFDRKESHFFCRSYCSSIIIGKKIKQRLVPDNKINVLER